MPGAGEKLLAEQVARCAPLPAGFTDAESLLRAWEDARRAAQKLRADESALRAERAGLLASPPDKSSEETDRELADAEAAFQSRRERGPRRSSASAGQPSFSRERAMPLSRRSCAPTWSGPSPR